MFTLDELDQALPLSLKGKMTPEIANNLNTIITDPQVAQAFRDNFVSYTNVLKEGKFKLESYMDAVAYVSFKLMGMTNQDAYFRTFPARHAALVAKGIPAKDIAAYVSAYARGKLPNLIMEQSLVPTWVLNQDMHQKALNVQFELMNDNNVSPKVRRDAANSILTHLAKPKEAGPLINFDMREGSGMEELKAAMADLAQKQQDAINGGMTTKEIADQRIVDVVAKEV